MPRPLLIVSQSDYLNQVVDTNSHLNGKQCRSIYTVCKSRAYPGAAEPGLIFSQKTYLRTCTLSEYLDQPAHWAKGINPERLKDPYCFQKYYKCILAPRSSFELFQCFQVLPDYLITLSLFINILLRSVWKRNINPTTEGMNEVLKTLPFFFFFFFLQYCTPIVPKTWIIEKSNYRSGLIAFSATTFLKTDFLSHYKNTPYSNILKISPPKADSFQIKILIFFKFLLKT